MRVALFALCCGLAGLAAEKKLTREQLPPAVQQAVAAETKGAEVLGFSTEREGGKTVYEAETKVGGLTRDITFSAAGAVLEVEEEVAMESLPPAVRKSITKKAAGAKVEKVEKITRVAAVSWEATVLRNGKRSEFTVKP
jgi:hypothetical protein